MEEGIHISLKAEHVTELFGFPITNTLLMSWLAMAILITIAFFAGRTLSKLPGRFQIFFEWLIGALLTYLEETLENKRLARTLLPFILTLFLFILAGNWLGLLPGVGSILVHSEGHAVSLFHPMATDLNVTLALSIIVFVAIEVLGARAVGVFTYASKFFNFHSLVGFFVGIIELLSEFARLVSFSFRLFGNMFAGKTLILVAMFFVPLLLPVPLMLYEVLVGFVQAAIFAMLTLFFVKIAVAQPH